MIKRIGKIKPHFAVVYRQPICCVTYFFMSCLKVFFDATLIAFDKGNEMDSGAVIHSPFYSIKSPICGICLFQ
jgi:hypothetical protein